VKAGRGQASNATYERWGAGQKNCFMEMRTWKLPFWPASWSRTVTRTSSSATRLLSSAIAAASTCGPPAESRAQRLRRCRVGLSGRSHRTDSCCRRRPQPLLGLHFGRSCRVNTTQKIHKTAQEKPGTRLYTRRGQQVGGVLHGGGRHRNCGARRRRRRVA